MKFSMKRYKKVNVLIQKSECFSENNNTRDKNSVPNRYVFQKDWHSPVFESKVFPFEMSNMIIPVGVAVNAAVQIILRTTKYTKNVHSKKYNHKTFSTVFP